MGPCISSADNSVSKHDIFLKDKIVSSSNVCVPLETTLYNLLRKRLEIQILVNPSVDLPLFYNQIPCDPKNKKASQLKMLCGFKNVLLVGIDQEGVDYIRQNSNPKMLYVINVHEAIQFLKKYPIFKSEQPKNQPKNIPIMVVNNSEIKTSKNKSKVIFLHSEKYKNQKIYQKLSISQTVTNKTQNNKKVASALHKNTSSHILFLHRPDTSQQDLLQILTYYLKIQCNTKNEDALTYFQKILPQAAAKQKGTRTLHVIKTEQNAQNLQQKLQDLLNDFSKQIGQDQTGFAKLERSYTLLINLLSNIYNNKDSQNFRRVRKTNKQINQMVGKYKNGQKLLQQLNFEDDGAFYVNNTDIKYLKLYRIDLELAYKNFKLGHENNNK